MGAKRRGPLLRYLSDIPHSDLCALCLQERGCPAAAGIFYLLLGGLYPVPAHHAGPGMFVCLLHVSRYVSLCPRPCTRVFFV